MVIVGSNLRVIDKSGALMAQCIRFVDKAKFSYTGMKILVVVKKAERAKRRKRSVRKSEIHLALIVKEKGVSKRMVGYSIYSPATAIILLRKSDSSPMSNRLVGTVSKSLRFKAGYLRVLSMSYDIL